jgi:hypothetical protein
MSERRAGLLGLVLFFCFAVWAVTDAAILRCSAG